MTSIFDLFQLIASNVWLYGGTFLIVLSVLVFVHEWGHYIVARLCGVKVDTFSIGFGKELFGFNDKNGTRWKFSLIPLGGYVQMFGDTDPASAGHSKGEKKADGDVRPHTAQEKQVAFYTKPVWKRALIVAAGPGINFLFAIILLMGLYIVVGQPVTPPHAAGVIVGSAAEEAGFMPHDKVMRINGEKVRRFEDIRRIVTVALDTPLTFEIERGGDNIELTVTPKKETLEDRFGFSHSRGVLGIIGPSNGLAIKAVSKVDGQDVVDEDSARRALMDKMDQQLTITMGEGEQANQFIVKPLQENNTALNEPDSPEYGSLVVSETKAEVFVHHGLWGGLTSAVQETWSITGSTLRALGQMVTGTRSATELGGLIRIGAIAGDMAQAGLIAIITFTALLSINLGLINLFPIPMLDGGHLVFYAIEALKGKPVPERVQEYAFRVGFILLVGLMLFANLNDVFQLVM